MFTLFNEVEKKTLKLKCQSRVGFPEYSKYLYKKHYDIYDDDLCVGELDLLFVEVKACERDHYCDVVDLLYEMHPDVYEAIVLDYVLEHSKVIIINNFQIYEKYRNRGYGRLALDKIISYVYKYFIRDNNSVCLCAQIVPKHYSDTQENVDLRLLHFYLINGFDYVGFNSSRKPLVMKDIW